MKTKQFTETLIDYVDGKVRKSILTFKLTLGGGAGPGGGDGLPWNSIVGQLIQKRVAFDTTMSASPCMDPASGYWLQSGSLLDNLNLIRYRQLPATWFETSPTDLRGLSVNVASGVWYDAENSYFIFSGGVSPTFTLPTTNPRVDVVYVTSSGTIGIQQGVEAPSPSITMPTASGVLPTWAVYLPPGAAGIGYSCETYSGYLYQDLRPFMSYPGGGGGGGTGGVPNLTFGVANAEGAADTFIRTDASIAIFDAVVPGTIQCDDAAAAGAAAFAARRDHQHAIVCAAPASPSVNLAASAEGVATSFARSDHTHQLDESIAPTWTDIHLFQDLALNTANPCYVIEIDYVKTLGASDANDDLCGIYSEFELNQAGGTVGNFYGAVFIAKLTQGVTAVAHGMWGSIAYLNLVGGTVGYNAVAALAKVNQGGTSVTDDLFGVHSWLDLNTGSTGGNIYGIQSLVDIAAGYTTPAGDVFGLNVYVTVASDPTGDVYMLYLDEIAGVDYGIYQNGTAANYLGGRLGIGVAPSTAYHLVVADATLNTAAAFRGIYASHTKTAGGASGADYYGIQVFGTVNEPAGGVRDLIGMRADGLLTDGTVSRSMYGGYLQAEMNDGAVTTNVYGMCFVADLNDGDVGGNVYGLDVYVDIDLFTGVGAIGGNVYGQRIWIDVDTDPAGSAYALYIDARSHVDYGVYVTGGVQNYFASFTGFGTAAPGARVEVNGDASDDPLTILDALSDTDSAFVDFKGGTGASCTASISTLGLFAFSDEDHIKIKVNGNVRYLRTYLCDAG